MALSGQIRWSKREYGMRELVDTFGHSLPVLCKIMAGFDGGDDDLNIVSSDEVYWIYAIQKQTRLVAQTENKRYASIPVDYALGMHFVNKHNKAGEAVRVQEVVDRLITSAAPSRVMLENNKRVAVGLGDDGGTSAQFGIMTVLDTYDQKYLVGNPILELDICQATVGLPVYLDVSFVVAEGFVHTDNDDEFRTWFRQVSKVQETFERKPIRTFKEIIVFSQCPASSEYEYIRPTALDGGPMKDRPRKPAAENEYVVTGFYCKTSRRLSANQTPNDYSRASSLALPQRPSQRKAECSPSPHQSTAKRPPPPPVPSPHQSATRQDHGGSLRCRVLPSSPRVLPPATVAVRKASPYSPISPEMMPPKPSLPPGQPPRPRPKAPLQSPSSSNSHQAPAKRASGGYLPWNSVGEIPKDVDVSRWTKQDVADCLRLLKLDKYTENFQAQDVDGQLLLCLDENMMTDADVFAMTKLDAIKLRKFVHDAWRPT